jgi:inositol transport system ATP-binding protein
VLSARNVTKSFGGAKALDGVSIEVEPGKVLALVGENGAGKSTLMKILAGQLAPDSGEVVSRGAKSIALIHQELTPVLDLTVAENIFLGREPVRFAGWVDRKAMWREAGRLLERLGSKLDPGGKMRGLSVADLQIVEIAKALARNADVILTDEPTSALSAHESEAFFGILRELTSQGAGIVYTSHKMDEIFRLADAITVLRDGRHVATRAAAEFDEPSLIAMMVGRELDAGSSGSGAHAGETVLELQNLTRPGVFADVSFSLRRGEIVGIAGLMGAGRTELASAIFGLAPASRGAIRVKGRQVRIASPADALANGIAMVTEDRKVSGIVPLMSVKENMTLASLDRAPRAPWIDGRGEAQRTSEQMEALRIKARDHDQPIWTLSGGNQQKIMIARALLCDPDVLILDEPTRGIDVGAKAEVHEIMRRLARAGKAILMISSEMPEILALSDRILVMEAGRLRGELDPRRATQEGILKLAMPN